MITHIIRGLLSAFLQILEAYKRSLHCDNLNFFAVIHKVQLNFSRTNMRYHDHLAVPRWNLVNWRQIFLAFLMLYFQADNVNVQFVFLTCLYLLSEHRLKFVSWIQLSSLLTTASDAIHARTPPPTAHTAAPGSAEAHEAPDIPAVDIVETHLEPIFKASFAPTF